MIKKAFIIFALLIFSSLAVSAWEDCPYGKVNDAYPGDCGRYVDTDDDEICDYSQPSPEDRVESSFVESMKTEETAQVLNSATRTKVYHFIPIVSVLTILYLISYYLSKKKKITVAKHRMFWNFLLLISFLISSILGIILIIKINFGLTSVMPFNSLFWHVEIGIVMVTITIFHMLWHLPYFKIMFKTLVKFGK